MLIKDVHTVNFLWHNNQGKGFKDLGTLSGTGFSQAGEATVSMSVDFADTITTRNWIYLFQMTIIVHFMKI